MAWKTVVLVLACWLTGTQAWGVDMVGRESIVVDSGKLRLTFGAGEGRLSLRGLADSAGTEWLGEFGEKNSVWVLALQGPGGETKEIGSAGARLSKARADAELWLMPDGEPLSNVDESKKASDYFGVPISLHWYRWHQIPFDTLYPEYFPANDHFGDGVKALQAAGFHVMPYINGRLCDPKSKTWIEEHAEKAAARKSSGEPYTEVYGSKVPLNVMCPYTKQWQDKIAGLVDRLVNQCGVDSVYIDQICAAAAVPCFDTAHGHPIGGGHF